ncbi:hypothetical protein TNCV_798251 [Trichonephila clavipes]|nr:hypothetical protein TNCV_798251 [Trichonephila clavipes]
MEKKQQINIIYNFPKGKTDGVKHTPSVRGTEKLRLVVTQERLNTINAEPGFLRLLVVSENENSIERIPFSEQRRDKTERDGGVEYQSKRSLTEVFSAAEGILG